MGRSIVGSVLLLVLASSSAQAQGTWAVVVAQVGGPSPSARHVADVAAVRLRGLGAAVVDVPTARAAVESQLGRSPEPFPADFARRLSVTVDEALAQVADARNDEALATVEPLLVEAESHLAAIGTDEAVRADLTNLCAFAVRAHLQAGRSAEARARALDCARFHPTLEMSRFHPPEVREVVDAARDDVAGGPHGVLAISGVPGCAVVANGSPLGETPFERALPPGSYEVQLACSGQREERVWRVVVPREGRADVTLDPELSARLDARDGVVLAYPDEDARRSLLPRDAVAIARMLEVRNVLAVSEVGSEVWLERAQRVGGVTASTRLPANHTLSGERVGHAVTALLEGRGAPDAQTPAEDGGTPVVGYVLGGVGAAALVTSVILYATWVDAQRQVDALDPTETRTEFEEAVAARDDRGTVVVGVGAASAALLTLSVPFLVSAEEGVPWWSWIAGVAGLGAIAFGVIHTTQDEVEVDNSTRGVPVRTIPLGPLVAMHGAPLLAIPITHLVRAATGSDATATAAFDANGARCAIGGRF